MGLTPHEHEHRLLCMRKVESYISDIYMVPDGNNTVFDIYLTIYDMKNEWIDPQFKTMVCIL